MDMEQPDPRELSRATDPITSAEAAYALHATGVLGERMAWALSILVVKPGSTASELDPHGVGSLISKRLNDLRKAGYARVAGVRPCRVTGKRAQLWWPV